MGLLDGTTQRAYYQEGEKGNYQFTSLEDIINQFMVAYVGEEKIISKVSRTDVAFYAQRAMQELSFDTFKSVKSQEITLPPSLIMMLPHDYVNYTKLSWSDTAGIEHVLYPTSKTSNPFKILQEEDGFYDFTGNQDINYLLVNADFSTSGISTSTTTGGWVRSIIGNPSSTEDISITDEALRFRHGAKDLGNGITARAYAVYQAVDATNLGVVDLSASGLSAAAVTNTNGIGTIRIGFTTHDPHGTVWNLDNTDPTSSGVTSNDDYNDIFNVQAFDGDPANNIMTDGFITFNDGLAVASTTTLTNIDLTGLTQVYLVITSEVSGPFTNGVIVGPNNGIVNTIDDVTLLYDGPFESLQTDGDSTTWTSYQSATPSENQDDYQDDTYWPNNQKRYGLDPQHAQVNGSFYIDNLKGLINFSSSISGKTVILDYISDSLGTDGEMQVHKFAEEAMYKWIMYAVLSTRANTPEYIVRRYQKEKFAATRQAKLRLSNIKLEELTQILRGKSKHIKH